MSEPMDVRYQTKAAEYYRKKLRAFCNDDEFNEEKPDYEEGRLPIEYKIKSHEEIKDAVHGANRGESNAQGMDKAKEVLGSLWDGTKKVTATGYGYASSGVKKVGDKLDESGVTEKVKSGAKTVGTKTIEIGGIAYNKTKDGIVYVASNEKVQEISSKAWNGTKEGVSSVWGFFSKAINGNSGANNAAQGVDAQYVPDAPAPHAPVPHPPTDT